MTSNVIRDAELSDTCFVCVFLCVATHFFLSHPPNETMAALPARWTVSQVQYTPLPSTVPALPYYDVVPGTR